MTVIDFFFPVLALHMPLRSHYDESETHLSTVHFVSRGHLWGPDPHFENPCSSSPVRKHTEAFG